MPCRCIRRASTTRFQATRGVLPRGIPTLFVSTVWCRCAAVARTPDAARKLHVEFTYGQDLAHWLACHAHASAVTPSSSRRGRRRVARPDHDVAGAVLSPGDKRAAASHADKPDYREIAKTLFNGNFTRYVAESVTVATGIRVPSLRFGKGVELLTNRKSEGKIVLTRRPAGGTKRRRPNRRPRTDLDRQILAVAAHRLRNSPTTRPGSVLFSAAGHI